MSEYALGELLAVVLARRLRNGELGSIGTASPIPIAACNLAQRRGCWVSWLSGPLGVLDPRTDRLLPAADERLMPAASAVLDSALMIDVVDWRKHFFDFAILGAMQVDRFGNLNTVSIGPHERPTVRGPGTIAESALAGLSRRFMVLVTRHEPSVLVERVDFCSAVGHYRGGRTRETELGLPPGGPDLVLTPLGCFDFHPDSRAMRIESLHPGVTLETVRAQTGFELIVDGRPRATPPPDDEELETLRLSVDSEGILRKWT